jgi:hypothetical protein
MKTQHLYKIFNLAFLLLLVTNLQAQNTLETARKAFLRGNFSDKLVVINSISADSEELHPLIIEAANFILECSPYFTDEKEYKDLSIAVIERFNPKNKDDSELLENMYTQLKNATTKLMILTTLSKIEPQPETITNQILEYLKTMVTSDNNYTGEKLEQALSVAADSKKTVFFPILLECYANSDSNTVKAIAKRGIDALAPDYKDEVIKIFENNSGHDKLITLQLVLQNDKNSDFFKAEIAENALKNAILSTGNVADTAPIIIDLQLASVKELDRNLWTRASSLLEQFFILAEQEFKKNLMTEDQFILSITAFSDLNPTKASLYLTDYLGDCNTRFEANGAYSEPIVLTVIQTLGKLRNHVAFDNLLYTTYLEYPEVILSAARDALVKLKW